MYIIEYRLTVDKLPTTKSVPAGGSGSGWQCRSTSLESRCSANTSYTTMTVYTSIAIVGGFYRVARSSSFHLSGGESSPLPSFYGIPYQVHWSSPPCHRSFSKPCSVSDLSRFCLPPPQAINSPTRLRLSTLLCLHPPPQIWADSTASIHPRPTLLASRIWADSWGLCYVEEPNVRVQLKTPICFALVWRLPYLYTKKLRSTWIMVGEPS